MSQSSSALHTLLQNAADEGDLSQVSVSVLQSMDLTPVINNALGTSPDMVSANEAILLGMLIDDSSSIEQYGNVPNVISGTNLVLDAQLASKQRDAMLVHIALLNGTQLCEYRPLESMFRLISKEDLVALLRAKDPKVVYEVGEAASQLRIPEKELVERIEWGERLAIDSYNLASESWAIYWPTGGTPLYKESIPFYAKVVAKTQELRDAGIAVRSIELTNTDGDDLHSGQVTASDVSKIVEDMLRTERHIVAGMGIQMPKVDFRTVYGGMGIQPRWILTPKNKPAEIRAAFMTFSQSAQRASQSAASFSQTAVGGFSK
jgi:hypothetical protein